MAGENNDVVQIPMGSDPDLSSDSDSSSSSSSSSNSDVNIHPNSDSDGDSATSEVTVTGGELDSFTDGRLVRVNEDDEKDQFVKQKFVDVMFALGQRTVVETVYKNVCTSLTWQAKLRSFLTTSQFMEKIGEGCGKVKYAWFGGSRNEINNIFRYGFASRGRGICLSPFLTPLPSLRGSVVDENGLCHMILCRVILGRSEQISPQQRFPSSEEFHSGVDNLLSPRVYLVWSSHMNTHVLPQYVVSFRPPVKVKDAAAGSAFRLIPLTLLIQELAMVLPLTTITTLQKLHRDCREGKIMKSEMSRKLVQIAGTDVLYRTLISLKRRQDAPDRATTPRDSNNVDAGRVVLPRQSGSRSSANRVLKKLRGARSS